MTQSHFRKILLESLITPNQPGKMAVVLDANNPDYFVQRAEEAIRVAKQNGSSSVAWHSQLTMAITLLVAARAIKSQPSETVKQFTPTDYAKTILGAGADPSHFQKRDGNMNHASLELTVPVRKWKATLLALDRLKQAASGKDDHGA